MAKIEIKKGDGDDPSELAKAICAIGKFPFTATLTHKAVKPLFVPSTGMSDVIAPGKEGVSFKVKNFEQAWVLVTDSAALASRYNSDEEGFVVIEVPDVEKEKTSPRKAADKAAGVTTEGAANE
ncbi:hypothetical protein C1893_23130 [Pseudomonas sp. MPR-ANC1]|uniref:hypothetical protein n=1 Tax=Pseudomonas sp. MPR-ANC1 TaxID=2075548 RepID=UPI000CD32215|nr:hypothetical protein [Pseudomonas sp. MPR-ANC1]POA45552.1 hypothetical protein C1893_23130 [Pseudomonas sp. MPR-ANC1]